LKDDIKPILKMLKPVNLLMAFAQEKWQEEFNNVIAKKSRIIQRINHSFNSGRPTYNFSIKTSNHSKNESLKQSFNNLIEKKKD